MKLPSLAIACQVFEYKSSVYIIEEVPGEVEWRLCSVHTAARDLDEDIAEFPPVPVFTFQH